MSISRSVLLVAVLGAAFYSAPLTNAATASKIKLLTPHLIADESGNVPLTIDAADANVRQVHLFHADRFIGTGTIRQGTTRRRAVVRLREGLGTAGDQAYRQRVLDALARGRRLNVEVRVFSRGGNSSLYKVRRTLRQR